MTGRANIPRVRVVVDGRDITPVLEQAVGSSNRKRLISLTLTEKRGGEADQLDLVIDDTDGGMPIPRAGARAEISIGWLQGQDVTPGLTDKGSFVVEEIEHGGPPDQLTIRARAADFTSEIRTRRERSWHDTTIGALVSDLAKRNGLEPRCASSLASIAIPAAAQSRESDIAFLRRLGRAHDAIATIKRGRLLFAPIGAGVTATGKPLPQVKIRRRDGDQHTFRIEKPEEAGTVEAGWHDRKAGERKHERAGGGGKTRRLSRVYADQDSAAAAAKAEHSRASRKPQSLGLTLALGDPHLFPEQKATVTGFKPQIDAVPWLVSEVTHTIADRGYSTVLKLEAA